MLPDLIWLQKAKLASKRKPQSSESQPSLISKKSGIPFQQEKDKKAREMHQAHGTITILNDNEMESESEESLDEKAYAPKEFRELEKEQNAKEQLYKVGGKSDAAAKKDAGGTDDLFSEKWWKKVRPTLFFTDPGLDKKLREYELAAELAVNHSDPADYDADYIAVLKALDEIGDKAAEALKICQKSPTILEKTIERLEKYPEEIAKKKQIVKQSWKKRTELQQPAQDDGGGDGGGDLAVYFKCDIAQGVLECPPLDNYSWLKFDDCTVQLAISAIILNLLKKGEGHTTLDAMVLDAKEACDEVITKIAKEAVSLMRKHGCQRTDGKGSPVLNPGAAPNATQLVLKELKDYVDAQMKVLRAKVDQIPQARWENWIKQKAEYKKYKLKTGKKIGMGVLGVAGSALTVGLAVPTGGASLAVGIVTLVKTTTHVVDLSVQLWKEAEDIQEELQEDLGKLTKAYLDENGKAKELGGVKTMGLQEMGKAVVKEATLGLSELAGHLVGLLGKNPGWNASLSSCKSDYKTLLGKLGHLAVNNQEFAAAAVAALDAIESFEKELEANKDDRQTAGKILVKINKLRDIVDKCLKLSHSLGGRIRAIEKVLPDLEKCLNALDGENPAYAEIFTTLLPGVVDVFLAAGNAAAGFTAATEAEEFIIVAMSLCSDLVGALSQSGGAWVGLGKRFMGK